MKRDNALCWEIIAVGLETSSIVANIIRCVIILREAERRVFTRVAVIADVAANLVDG
jgi:hypothetical protein